MSGEGSGAFRRWRRQIGDAWGVLGLVAIGAGYLVLKLTGIIGPSEDALKPGDCFTGSIVFAGSEVRTVDCQENTGSATYVVLFNEEAEGDNYPGTIRQLAARCEQDGGRTSVPSQATWGDGDRNVICFDRNTGTRRASASGDQGSQAGPARPAPPPPSAKPVPPLLAAPCPIEGKTGRYVATQTVGIVPCAQVTAVWAAYESGGGPGQSIVYVLDGWGCGPKNGNSEVLAGCVSESAGVSFDVTRTGNAPPAPATDAASLAGCGAGCEITGDIAFDHPTWGRSRLLVIAGGGEVCGQNQRKLVVLDSRQKEIWQRNLGSSACASLAAHALPVDGIGHLFVRYNPGRFDGVIVLRPVAGGMEDFGSIADDPEDTGRFYSSEVTDADSDGIFEIEETTNDCDPDCAGGTDTVTVYRWNGRDYAP